MRDKIASYSTTTRLLNQHSLRARKSLGQNFLVDSFVAEKIINAADIAPDELVIEIGPGLGALTQNLCQKAKALLAVEIDSRLCDILRTNIPKVNILEGDAQKLDFPGLASRLGFDTYKVVANLPYYITTPLLMKLLEDSTPESRLHSATLMVQREVAARISANPGSKEYGALSLGVAYRASTELVANVPRNCFLPRPNVDSAVVHLRPHHTPPVAVADENLLFALIKSAFSTRRKTLLNCLATLPINGQIHPKTEIASLISSAGLSPNIRGEQLSLAQFALLANIFHARYGLYSKITFN